MANIFQSFGIFTSYANLRQLVSNKSRKSCCTIIAHGSFDHQLDHEQVLQLEFETIMLDHYLHYLHIFLKPTGQRAFSTWYLLD